MHDPGIALDPDPLDVTTHWRSGIDPATLTTSRLLADLLSYDDGFNGRRLRATADEETIVGRWIATPRGKELAARLRTGQANYSNPTYLAGWDDGYERAVADSFSPLAGFLVVAIVSALVGLIVGWAIGLAT